MRNKIKAEWLNEPDSEELQQMATVVRESYVNSLPDEALPCPDVDAAWEEFARKHRVQSKHRGWQKWIAAACVLLISVVGYAAFQTLKPASETPALQQETLTSAAVPFAATLTEVETDDLVYHNVSLKQIVEELASLHGAKVSFQRNVSEVRLYTQLSRKWTLAECISFLNKFDQVNLQLEHNTITVK